MEENNAMTEKTEEKGKSNSSKSKLEKRQDDKEKVNSQLLVSTYLKQHFLQADVELIEEDEFIVESILDKLAVKKGNLST